jgi:hypothetical protein
MDRARRSLALVAPGFYFEPLNDCRSTGADARKYSRRPPGPEPRAGAKQVSALAPVHSFEHLRDVERWVTRWRPDYAEHPMSQYTIMIRGESDPERRERGREAGDVAPHRTLEKGKVEDFERAIVELLSDGRERTFNAISVEMLDKPADITAGSKVEEALWNCVLRGEVEFTTVAPILFRARA